MFEKVTATDGGKAVARRGVFVLGSTAIEGGLLAALIAIAAWLAPPKPPPDLGVLHGPVLVRAPAPSKKGAGPPAAVPKRVNTRRPPTGLVQPHVVAPTPLPTPDAAPGAEPDAPAGAGTPDGMDPDGDPDSTCKGSGCTGKVGEGQGGNAVIEAPRYPGEGFIPPAEDEHGCVASGIRLPPDLRGFTGKVMVKFAVGTDGATDLFQFMTPSADPRIELAVKNAIRSCRFRPGRDTLGQAQRIWLILPLRLEGSR